MTPHAGQKALRRDPGGLLLCAWTEDARRFEKEQQQAAAWDLWLDCKSYRNIEKALGVDHDTVASWVSDFGNSADFRQPPDSRQHFDVWTFPTADDAGTGRWVSAKVQDCRNADAPDSRQHFDVWTFPTADGNPPA